MKSTFLKLAALLLALAGLDPWLAAQTTFRLPNTETPAQRDARLAWWREARFGMFIHWGPSSVRGTEISWSRIGHPHDHRGLESVPPEEYDALYRRFDPVKFDADAWMRLAREAGMKYVVFTTKHHDGFSMWPTRLRPDYSISATPFPRDPCRELADAARRHGLKLGWYYSTRDWTHPDYLVGDNRRYDEFQMGQVRELLSGYGRVDLLWFDHVAGNWRDYRFQEMFETIYGLQPGILVNNRAAAFIRPTEDQPTAELRQLVAGDFDTPEQRIGAFQHDRPWESCVTMTECADGGGWSYRPDGRTRDFKECVRMLVNCAAGDGNLLLNVGPLPTGEIAADQQAVLRQMGAWLAKHGESVYATRGGPFRNGDWGGATFRDRSIYLHVLKWNGDRLQLPALKARVLRATALTGGSPRFEQTPAGLSLMLSPADQDPVNTVLKLELDAPAAGEFVEGKPLTVPEPVVLRLDSPLDHQVFQRSTAGEGGIRVSGRAPAGTDRIEAQIGGDWRPLEFKTADGTFDAVLNVPAGGWHVCRVRATGAGKLFATVEVSHVGVGEVFVVAGQSNSANHGEEKLSSATGLVAAFDGTRWQPARDPQPGASGSGGSFIPPLGDALAARFKVPVGFVACGIGATSVREWLPKGATFPHPPTLTSRVRQLPDGGWESDGAAFSMLTTRLKSLGPRGFRAVLWHQGESDANQQDPTRTLPGELYRKHLEQLIRESQRELGWDVPWFVAQVSYHVPGDEASPDIRAAQKSLWDAGLALEGPDTDGLKGELREAQGQGVHFSGAGLREHAARWTSKVVPWLETQLTDSEVNRPTASGYPSRDPNLDALPGFQNPPPGYGEVPFWWWTGDPLDEERLIWQLDQLHQKGISGVQVNYAHEDSPGWPTYAAQPPLFSEPWWRIWGRIADECRQRGMGIGLSTYTLDWPGATNLFRQLFYSQPELNALKLTPLPRPRLKAGESTTLPAPADLVAARAYRIDGGTLQTGGVDLMPHVRDGQLAWTAPDGEWELWLVRAERQANTLNPLLTGIGEIVIRGFYQRFQDATPTRSPEGLNYFFNDELHVGAGAQVWNADLAAEFRTRKGYDLFEVLPALWSDVGPTTPKIRMDYADVRMALMEERYFRPIYQWHASRGLIFACDSGGRGLQPDEFGDYFRATRWYTAPGHDTPGGHADLIKGKVSSSIANLYRRPRVWLEGYHSLGWGATPERLMFATRENYLYGCTLLNLHGLYYTTHGSFWEWAPPCYHFRMPYWEHLGVFLKYFERLSYLLSQGSLVCDVAVVYPVAPFEAGLDGSKATQTAFDTARGLMAAGINFEFLDADSLARAHVRNGRLEVADSSYRALIFPAMEAVRWTSLEQAERLGKAGGLVLSVGALPFASDRAGRHDPELDALVTATFAAHHRLAKPADVAGLILEAFTPDTRADRPVRSLHRKVGPRDVYLVMDAAKHSTVEFRAKGRVELWDPWTGAVQPLRVLGETETGTKVEMPLEDYEVQLVVFTPGQPQVNPPARQAQAPEMIPLDGEWAFELKPTMDNRHGDFRLPVTEKIIGPEARLFRHAVETGDATAWNEPGFDDRGWDRVTHDIGPQFWLLGPLPTDAPTDALEAGLAVLRRVDPREPVTLEGKSYAWRPYRFSWRQGIEGDPGHQGWHGLKENVTDHFLGLGQRGNALNEYTYEAETNGSRYYLWTSATVDAPTTARIVASAPQDGVKPHASEILTPAAVFLNGERLGELRNPVSLRAGANPLLVRYDQAGRGYFVMRRDAGDPTPPGRTPLAMTWFDDPTVIRFDVHAGAQLAEWFRFTAPPGLRAMTLIAQGTVQAWADGQPLRAVGNERMEVVTPSPRAVVVALRVVPRIGISGGAVFPDPVRLECDPGAAALGDWSKAGVLESYSGGAWYRKTVTLTPEQARGGITLDLGKVVATAEVRVNGEPAGIRVAPPWRVDISKQVQSGENRIEVLVFNTLANHYLTIPTRYRGESTSGLLGPVTLEVTTATPARESAKSPPE
ncbi:MAG: alpha-L-fucosidase [Limisphaerales bacterium]